MNRKISVYCGALPLRDGEVLADLPNNMLLVKVQPLQVSNVLEARATMQDFCAWTRKGSNPDRVSIPVPAA